VFAWLLLPASAVAGTVNLNAGELDYTASDGEENVITVTGENGHVTIRDAGHTVQIVPFSEPGCTQDASDTATCPAVAVNVDANDMNDTVDASAVLLTGSGPAGGVFVSGGDGSDRLIGCPYTDTLEGDSDVDDLDGRAGNDFLTGGAGNDTEAGGPGNDSLEASAFGTLGDDLLQGGPGDDTFLQPQREPAGMSDGADTFQGGDGRDTADYRTSTGGLTVSLDGVPNDGYSGEGDNIQGDVENLVGGPAADMLTGSDAANTIDGGGGNDTLTALGGDDTLIGGDDAGNDNLDAGSGNDSLSGGPAEDTLNAGDGDDTVDGNGGNDRETGGSGVDTMAGGAGNDDMDGGPGADDMRGADSAHAGADGADTIHGGEGTDQLSGEDGNDTLDGGGDADVMSGGAGKDRVDYGAQQAAVTVTIDDKADDGSVGEHDDVASDIEDVRGGNFDTTVTGNVVNNELTGGSGEDYVDGAGGSDTITGGKAPDILRSRGDGTADSVDCGPSKYDFVIADPNDAVKPSCEEVDVGNRKPVSGRRIVVQPAGTSFVKLNHVHRFVPLSDRVGLPLRSTIQPMATGVRLTAAARGGANPSGAFSGDAFLVKQPKGRSTELDLAGAFNLSKCPRSRISAAAKRPRRRLFGTAHGRFVTRGRFSSATVRGTRWSIEDRCDGTLTRVSQGSVRVRDFGRHITVTVKAGHSYLARRGNR
jgi:Ca2+-binding RTX toxin-like protein